MGGRIPNGEPWASRFQTGPRPDGTNPELAPALRGGKRIKMHPCPSWHVAVSPSVPVASASATLDAGGI